MKSFILDISYSQISVFRKGLENPFNDWDDTHIAQGFAWRPEAVSFGSLLNDGECYINISIQDKVLKSNGSIRTIVVPFEVKECGVEIASITDAIKVDIPSGIYELVFNIIPNGKDGLDVYEFAFVQNDGPKPRIILADELINPPDTLLMQAKPAV